MPGRDLNPGEGDRYGGLRDHVRYHSRLVRGKITDVNANDGSIQVQTDELIGGRSLTVPTIWFSARGRQSAWGRYMPLGNENVEIAYRNDDSAVVVGYNANAPKDKNLAGWPVLREFEENQTTGFATFKKLKRGEFDFKSSGDAYIYGSSGGSLLLAGGQAFIKLDKNLYKIDSKAACYSFLSETSNLRFGTVYRKLLPTDPAESPVQPGTFKEFLVDVNQAVAGIAAPQSKAKFHFGDILDSLTNVPEVSSSSGLPLRGRISLGDAANALEVFGLEIDQTGNVVWRQSTGALLGLDLSAQSISFNAPLSIKIGSTSASEPLVLGTALSTALTALINIFLTNAANFGIGNLGSPVPISPTIVSALQAWLTTHVDSTAIISNKVLTEKI